MRFVTIGECMLELRQAGEGLLRQGFAGDTLNSAFYARRALPPSWAVEFFSGFGTDRVSREMRERIEALGIDTSRSMSIGHRQSGLYMIHLDAGERSFSYWRSHSAARLLARDRKAVGALLAGVETVLFSGITLAILEDEDAEFLIEELAAARRAGATVAFDPNIRSNLWPDMARMRDLMARASRAASVALPSFDDEAAHFGDATSDATIDRFLGMGAEIVAVKNGAAGVGLAWNGRRIDVPAQPVERVIDSTGAGDSFNGVFLARLALGDDPEAAAARAVRAASVVIGHHGAIVQDFAPEISGTIARA